MMILPKRILLMALLVCSCLLNAQKKVNVKYYLNNTQLQIENVRFMLITRTDTLFLKIENGKIQIPEDLNEYFFVFAQFEGKTVRVGSFRPSMFNEIDTIIVGEITDFSTLRKDSELANTFHIYEENLIKVPEYNKIKDVIYSVIKIYEDMSLISNVRDYVPVYTSIQDIIAYKN